MKPIEKVEKEVLEVYDKWLYSYLNGDVETYNYYLDDQYHFIGSTNNEEFLDRKDTTKFFEATAEQLSGKTEIRNSKRIVEFFGDQTFITEVLDAFFLSGTEWNYYGRFRFSSVLQKKKDGWRFIYQHFSTPDSKAQEGQTIGYEQISEENLNLREAIKRRTVELEQKNRELKIEAALEKVRARSSAMQHANELGEVISIIFKKLDEFDISVKDGVALITFNEGNKDLNEWMANPGFGTAMNFLLPYFDHPILSNLWEAKNHGEEILIQRYSAEESRSFLNHIFEHSDFKHTPQPVKDYCLAANTYATSIAFQKNTAIFINDYSGISLTPLEIDLLKRFSLVFEQTYVRFLDLQKAEAQAREAQIEAALERVRSRSLAMHHTTELQTVIHSVHQELLKLNLPISGGSFIAINSEIENEIRCWGSGGTANTSDEVHIPRFEKPFYTNLLNGIKNGPGFFTEEYTREEKIEFFTLLFQHEPWSKLDSKQKEVTLSAPGGYTRSCTVSKHTSIFIINHSGEKFSAAENDILQRFGKVFEQSYARFLDLQKAEAQAREAEIELALEKVRARTMAMQKSDELAETASLLFQQVKTLGIASYTSGFTLWEKDNKDLVSWTSNANGSVNPPFSMPAIENEWHRQQYESWEKKEDFIVYDFTEQEMQDYYAYLRSFPALDEAFKISEASGIPTPARQVHNAFNFTHGNLLFITLQNVPEAYDIFKRFANVFEQTYTRFLDLQKAEAQAREAQIEAALERVRSRTMAMQRSSELGAVAAELFAQMNQLVTNLWTCGFVLCEKNRDEDEWWLSMDGDFTRGFFLPNIGDYAHATLYEGWVSGDAFRVVQLDGEALQQHYDWLMDIPVSRAIFEEMDAAGLARPDWQKLHAAYFSKGYLVLITREPCGEEEIFKRFAQVFDQTYTRFLDLQKAEAQAREAQVNLAVERVRARALAMFKSEEILQVVNKLKEEIMGLDIPNVAAATIHLREADGMCRIWDLTSLEIEDDGLHLPLDIRFRLEDTDPDFFMRRVWENNADYFVVVQVEADFKHTIQWLRDNGLIKQASETEEFFKSTQLKKVYHPTVPLNNGRMCIDLLDTPTPEIASILKKMAGAFDLAYKRFEDLLKAEAQTREAHIEAALERVRSRSMAMHKSDELADLSLELVKQVQELGVATWFCAFNIYDEDGSGSLEWGSNGQGTFPRYRTPREGIFLRYYEAGQSGESLLVNEISEDECPSHYEYLCTLPGVGEQLLGMKAAGIPFPTSQIDHVAFFKYGYLLFITYEPTPASHDIFKRFAKVFEQTYTRFLDLQKAETQAREAQIEAALERVRSRSMAMHKSEELRSVVSTLYGELQTLQVNFHVVVIQLFPDTSMDLYLWLGTADGLYDDIIHWPYINLPVLNELYRARTTGELLEYTISEADTRVFFEEYFKLEGVPQGRKMATQNVKLIDITGAFQKLTGIFLMRYTEGSYSPSEKDIITRFSKVFEQTYTRFLDLQKAEAQALEAIKRASVDRVRAEIASMRTISDLDRIQPLIWNELKTLGVPFIRCGVFIMDEEKQEVESFLSTPDGKSIAAFRLSYSSTEQSKQIVTHWQQKQIFKDYMDEAAFAEFTKNLVQQGAMASDEKYVTENRPTDLYLHFLPFLQGMLYVGNTAPLKEDELQMVQNLADAFSTAYARYEDFNKLEVAKAAVDSAMGELKATQSQLVQQEKMASLGELTAGIAHEIQNPLNFVNNFSEVNSELITEMNEEIQKGNYPEVQIIARGITENEKKINYHGKRAEAIVKNMLQHSRNATGQKESTDLNALCDEYLRLAYHAFQAGLKAKDKTFHVDFSFDPDPYLPLVALVPQEVGRVLLNLINNAFYAVGERMRVINKLKQQEDTGAYKPSVEVSTRWKPAQDKTGQTNSWVEIYIRDNGLGIPEDIRDKIFQPFFTTKPTGEGTGLGLSMVYDLIKTMGGFIEVRSNPGKGAEFFVRLPV